MVTRTQVYRIGMPLVVVVGAAAVGIALASGAVITAVIGGAVVVALIAVFSRLGAGERRRGNTAVDEPLLNVSVPTRRVIFGLTLVATTANLVLRVADGSHPLWVVTWALLIVGQVVNIVLLRRRGLL